MCTDMHMNIDAVPAGTSLFDLAVTSQPVGTPKDDLFYDEVEVYAPRNATVSEIVRIADLEALGYEGCRVIGVSNQSDGYVVVQDPNGDFK